MQGHSFPNPAIVIYFVQQRFGPICICWPCMFLYSTVVPKIFPTKTWPYRISKSGLKQTIRTYLRQKLHKMVSQYF